VSGPSNSKAFAQITLFVASPRGLEEEGLESVVSQWQVPEEKRVHLVNATADAETGEVMLSCLMREDRDGGIWYFREGRVSYAEGLLST
jgi:trehalose utilization protein